jgi:hypothetical protein
MARNRKDPYYHRGEPSRWVGFFKTLGILALMAAAFGIAWALTLSQPKKLKYDSPELSPLGEVPARVSAMLDQSKELEKNFIDATKIRDITPTDLINLRDALKLQIDYLRESQNRNLSEGNARIARMTVMLETYESKPLRDQSTYLELKAADLEKQNNLYAARLLLTLAAELEDSIVNNDDRGENYSSALSRAVQFRHHVDYLTAVPVNNESKAAEDAAEAALLRKDWTAAQQNFQRAHDLQQRLNREFPLQSFNNSDRLLQLDQQLAALRSLPEYQQIQKSLADAQAADDAGQSAVAAQYYQDALRRQTDLNSRYPNSRFADPKQVTLITAMLDTSQSRPLANDIQAQASAIFDELRNRQADQASASLPALYEKTTHFHQAYPQSTLLDADLQNRIIYLYFKRDDLAAIEDQVYGQLQPVPRIANWQMAKQEVNQSLYNLVAGGNPSRHSGPKLPVESVNWTEAKDFCLKLSWIIGHPVRLPTVEEFQLALGATDTLDLAATTWNFDNSSGQTHDAGTKAANANGFYDLLGNVSEWLELTVDEDEGKAPLSSGNALTPVDSMRSATINHIALTTRNPFTGFRFMVNLAATIPTTPAAKN